MESNLVGGLALAALVLMISVTGGIAYLTISEWRDRQRREKDAKSNRRKS